MDSDRKCEAGQTRQTRDRKAKRKTSCVLTFTTQEEIRLTPASFIPPSVSAVLPLSNLWLFGLRREVSAGGRLDRSRQTFHTITASLPFSLSKLSPTDSQTSFWSLWCCEVSTQIRIVLLKLINSYFVIFGRDDEAVQPERKC